MGAVFHRRRYFAPFPRGLSMVVRAVVLDIEGTIAPIAFVRDILFPYARKHLADFLADHGDEPAVASEIAAVRQAAPGMDVTKALLGWMDLDLKIPPLKALQGMIWQTGYDRGELRGRIYPDVPPCLRAWRERGLALYIYSSGSVPAQRLLLGHSDAGDLCPLFSGFFDSKIGAKREAASYQAIAAQIGVDASDCLFLSDVEAELDAARRAGWRAAQVVRENDGTVGSTRFPNCAILPDADALLESWNT